jgi:hypothetical protein
LALGTEFQGDAELWVTGKMSPKAKENLAKLGIGVVEEVNKRIEFQD